MRVLRDFCIVKVDKKYQDEVVTESGIKFFVDTTYRPEWHVTITGEVVGAAEKITDQFFETKGISPEIRVGDQIYFSYLIVDPVNEIEVGDDICYKADYPNIYAYKRDGVMHMIGGWVFVVPYIEKHGEGVGSLVLPEYMKTEVHKDMGTIYKIGKPLSHLPDLGLKEGDMVAFKNIAAFGNEIEGKMYYTMKQSEIMAKINM